jgi:hypothetical protein
MQENSVNLSCSPEETPRNSRLSFSNVNYISATWTLIVILRRLPLRCLTFGMLLKNGLNLVFPDLPMIGMKNDIPWMIKFFIYYISNQNPILLTTGAVRIISADYTC